VQIANRPEAIYTTKVDTAKADLVIGCDAIVTAGKTTLAAIGKDRTFVALNTHGTPTGSSRARTARPRCARRRASAWSARSTPRKSRSICSATASSPTR